MAKKARDYRAAWVPCAHISGIGLDKIRPIAEAAGFAADDALVDDFYNIATEYEHDRRRKSESIAQTRAQAKAILTFLENAVTGLEKLDPFARSRLSAIYRGRERRSLAKGIHDVERVAYRLKELLEDLPKAGPPNVWERDELFERLIQLYQSRSGRPFLFPGKRDKYRGADFVRGMVRLIEPGLTDKECNHSLRAARTTLRRRAKMEEYRPPKRP